jgi:hypothetical protein
MIDVRKIANFDWDSKSMKAADWGLAVVSLAIGIYLGSPLFIIGGILGGLVAYFRPMGKFQKFVNGLVVRR